MDVVETLETRYLPLLHCAAERLRERYPTFTLNAGSGPVGRLTSFQGHHVYLEAIRVDESPREPNCVALVICVRDLPGTPVLCDLSTGWGGDGFPPATGELDLLPPGGVAFGPEALQMIDEVLPRLEGHLDRCLSDWQMMYPRT
jgi:hypothetical protein